MASLQAAQGRTTRTCALGSCFRHTPSESLRPRLQGRAVQLVAAPGHADKQQTKQRRPLRVVAGLRGKAAAQAVTATTASFPALSATLSAAAPYILMVSACYSAVLILMMALIPNSATTKGALRTNYLLVPMALLYGALLLASWQPDTLSLILPGSFQAGFSGGFSPQFFPSLQNIVTLFSRSLTQGSFLLHLMFVNVFVARHFYFDGLIHRIPTRHTVLITALLAPLGVLSHYLTKAFYGSSKAVVGKDLRTRPTNVTEHYGQGIIIMEPYRD